jgi:hypothetical protein
VLAAEHFLDLARLDLLIEGLEGARELGVDGLARVGPLDEDGEVVALLLERQDQIAILLEAAASLLDFLRFGLILPEIGRGGAGFEAGQLFVWSSGFKDSSADPRRAC